MSQKIVGPSLIMKEKPTKHYGEEDICLGIPGWCLRSDCASFPLTQVLAYRRAVLKPNAVNLRNGSK